MMEASISSIFLYLFFFFLSSISSMGNLLNGHLETGNGGVV